jgi:hypothetical protein
LCANITEIIFNEHGCLVFCAAGSSLAIFKAMPNAFTTLQKPRPVSKLPLISFIFSQLSAAFRVPSFQARCTMHPLSALPAFCVLLPVISAALSLRALNDPNGAKNQLLMHPNINRLLNLCILWAFFNRDDQLISQKG